MSSVNKAILVGRLGADPEMRYTQSNTAVTTMNIATNETYTDSSGERREKTEWHRVVAWSRLAEICQQYLRKGSLVYVEGPIQTREWEDRDGNKRYTTEVKALTMQILDSKSGDASANGSGAPASSAQGRSDQGEAAMTESDPLDSDDSLPF